MEFEEHLTDEHAKKLFAKIDAKKASRYERTPPDDAPVTPTAPAPRISTGTTSFAVADADGNMIAVTQTLSTWGGTFYVSKGLGFLYNNHLRSNRLTAGAYGSLVPLMRSSHRPACRRWCSRRRPTAKKCRGWRSAAPATRGFRCRSTTSSPA